MQIYGNFRVGPKSGIAGSKVNAYVILLKFAKSSSVGFVPFCTSTLNRVCYQTFRFRRIQICVSFIIRESEHHFICVRSDLHLFFSVTTLLSVHDSCPYFYPILGLLHFLKLKYSWFQCCVSFRCTGKWFSLYIYIYFFKFISLFLFGCVGSSFLCKGFLQLWQAGATLHHGARASHYRGLSCCGAQAPDAQAQQLWLTGPVAPRHVGSSQTRAQTRVPCIGRRTPNHCATREAPIYIFFKNLFIFFFRFFSIIGYYKILNLVPCAIQ